MTAKALRRIAATLAAILAVEVAGIAALVSSAGVTATTGETAVELDDAGVRHEIPLYTQLDERWSGLPYAEGTISTSGCGLVCVSMAWERLSGETCTPPMLLNLVGNDYVQEGQNYMPGFCEWMAQQDPTLDYTVLYESRERALEESESGRMVFACMEGALYEGGREYGGHIVLITGFDGGRIEIHDPMTVYEVSLTLDEFNGVAWAYFISIGRS